NDRDRALAGQFDYMGGAARAAAFLPIPDRNDDVRSLDHLLADADVGVFGRRAVSGQGDDFIGGIERPFELIELVSVFEVLSIVIGGEGEQRVNLITR